jgi:uncharacterized membrane protein
MVAGPIGLLPMSLLLDLLYLARHDKYYAHAAFYTLAAGYASAVAAALAGLADYFAIPPNTPAKRVARLHGVLNAGVLGMTGAGLILRTGGKHRWGALPFLLNVSTNALLTVSAWYGGSLVYRYGLRVKGREELEGAPEIKPPADEKMEHVFVRLEELAERLYGRGSTNGSRRKPASA